MRVSFTFSASAHNLCSDEENLLTKRTSMEQHAGFNKSRWVFRQLTLLVRGVISSWIVPGA